MVRLESTADVKCEFLVKQMEQLTASNKQLSARVNFLEEFIAGTPDKVERPLFAAVNMHNFTISSDRKTITRNSNDTSGWQSVFSEQTVAAMGNRFTLTLINMGTELSVGVAKRGTGTSPANGLHSNAGSWMLFFASGFTEAFYSNGSYTELSDSSSESRTGNGCQLTVRLDPLNELIYFKANGFLLYTADIPKPFSDLYAAVDFHDGNQSVSFI